MKSTAVMALAAGLLGLAAALIKFQSLATRRRESTKPATWDDVEDVRRLVGPRMSEVLTAFLTLASAALGLASALSG